jgi:pyruvate/2-oxoglutarate dehydrogenase complex dihydrolipoamide dehydrogenase (E3) component
VIATGSYPLIPSIEGLEEVGYLTNEDVFDLRHLPASLIAVGGGPIG